MNRSTRKVAYKNDNSVYPFSNYLKYVSTSFSFPKLNSATARNMLKILDSVIEQASTECRIQE